MAEPYEIPLDAAAIEKALLEMANADAQPVAGSQKAARSGGIYQQIIDRVAAEASARIAANSVIEADLAATKSAFGVSAEFTLTGNRTTDGYVGNLVGGTNIARGNILVDAAATPTVTVKFPSIYLVTLLSGDLRFIASTGKVQLNIYVNGTFRTTLAQLTLKENDLSGIPATAFLWLAANDTVRLYFDEADSGGIYLTAAKFLIAPLYPEF